MRSELWKPLRCQGRLVSTTEMDKWSLVSARIAEENSTDESDNSENRESPCLVCKLMSNCEHWDVGVYVNRWVLNVRCVFYFALLFYYYFLFIPVLAENLFYCVGNKSGRSNGTLSKHGCIKDLWEIDQSIKHKIRHMMKSNFRTSVQCVSMQIHSSNNKKQNELEQRS